MYGTSNTWEPGISVHQTIDGGYTCIASIDSLGAGSYDALVIKADSLGTLDAVKLELKKRETDDIKIKIIAEGVGTISEGDIMLASSDEKTVIIGFAVKLEAKARDQADRFNIKPELFDIIYKLSEWFDTIVENRLPYEEKEVLLGTLKVMRTFSSQKDKHVVGGNNPSWNRNWSWTHH